MQIIKKISCMIDEEICDAEKYIKCALEYKDSASTIAEMFYSLSLDEIKHMDMLHKAVTRIISDVKESDDTRTEGMKIAYELLHEMAIDRVKEVRMLQSMFRE